MSHKIQYIYSLQRIRKYHEIASSVNYHNYLIIISVISKKIIIQIFLHSKIN